MMFPLSEKVAPRFVWRVSCPSTNTELARLAPDMPDLAVLATDNQTAGRGRLGRTWAAPTGASLAVSVLVRADWGAAHLLGWVPLLAGVGMTRAVRFLGLDQVALKWPNDVMVAGRKLSGLLTEMTPDGAVIGAGLNTAMTAEQRPVDTATSLALEGLTVDAALTDRVLAAYLRYLFDLIARWRAATNADELRALVEPVLATLGASVRVDQPGLAPLRGTAIGLDDDGRLLVRGAEAGSAVVAVSAGDVTHLRYE